MGFNSGFKGLIYALHLPYLLNSIVRCRIHTLLLFLVILTEVSTGTEIQVSDMWFLSYSLVTNLPPLQIILLLEIMFCYHKFELVPMQDGFQQSNLCNLQYISTGIRIRLFMLTADGTAPSHLRVFLYISSQSVQFQNTPNIV